MLVFTNTIKLMAMIEKLSQKIKSLSAYDHFLVFLIILSVLKIVNVFAIGGTEAGFHFLKLGGGLLAISSLLFFVFKFLFDKKKKYKHALISTLLILLVLSHADPDPVRGVAVVLLVYVAKFFVKIKRQNIFNPIVFGIGIVTFLSAFMPFMDFPPADFSGIDIRFEIMGWAVPIAILPIALSYTFNVGRMRKYPLVTSFIALSLLLGFLFGFMDENPLSFILITAFVGVAILTEPKTAPAKTRDQIVYGCLVALLITGIYCLDLPNAAILGVFIGNIGWFGWRAYVKRWLRQQAPSVT